MQAPGGDETVAFPLQAVQEPKPPAEQEKHVESQTVEVNIHQD